MDLRDWLPGVGVLACVVGGSYFIQHGAQTIHPGFGQIVLGLMLIIYGVGIIAILTDA